jgi:hypothetical protein
LIFLQNLNFKIWGGGGTKIERFFCLLVFGQILFKIQILNENDKPIDFTGLSLSFSGLSFSGFRIFKKNQNLIFFTVTDRFSVN